MKIDRYGSATYARNSDRELVQSEVLRMRKGIDEIAKAYLQARVVPITGMESGASIILRVGKTSEIAIEPLPYNANPVTWRYHSNDETIATVDETGLIKMCIRDSHTPIRYPGPPRSTDAPRCTDTPAVPA